MKHHDDDAPARIHEDGAPTLLWSCLADMWLRLNAPIPRGLEVEDLELALVVELFLGVLDRARPALLGAWRGEASSGTCPRREGGVQPVLRDNTVAGRWRS
jgi:hypothetical protein